MKKTTVFIAAVAALIFFPGCFTPQQGTTGVVTGSSYNSATDKTTYTVSPYGTAAIPGKWTKTHYNNVSFQQFFVNSENVEIALAFGTTNGYEFNANGKRKGFDFVKGFYEWDTDYFVKKYGLNRTLIESDSAAHYMVYRLNGKAGSTVMDTYFLIGERNGYSSNFSVSITDKWTAQAKVDFLKGLFMDNKQ
jgi:hypothetical protein